MHPVILNYYFHICTMTVKTLGFTNANKLLSSKGR